MGNDLRQALTALLPRLRRFGLALTGSGADADDLVQSTCERVLLRADQLREQTRLDAWLYGIMKNLWFDELRHRKVRRHDDIDQASGVIGSDGQAIVEGRMTLASVRRAMAELPTEQRTVLMLVCVDGLSYKETAETLGIPMGTVMSRLSRARQDLHQRLNEFPPAAKPFFPFQDRRRVPPGPPWAARKKRDPRDMIDTPEMDALLAAYADGELEPAAAAQVEAFLATSAEARHLLAIHRDTTALLRAAFPETLFARDADRLSEPDNLAVPQPSPAPRPRAARARYGWAMAASILMGIVGYGAGATWPDLLVSERDRMLTEVAEYHAVYSRETVHLVEVPAAQSDHLKAWLGRRVKRALPIPDFREAGLTFAGGRMVVLDGAPVAELMYTRENGLPIGFCVFYQTGKSSPVEVGNRGAVNLATWTDGSHAYVVVGEAETATIQRLAAMARQQI